jgi:hypothetical protein
MPLSQPLRLRVSLLLLVMKWQYSHLLQRAQVAPDNRQEQVSRMLAIDLWGHWPRMRYLPILSTHLFGRSLP